MSITHNMFCVVIVTLLWIHTSEGHGFLQKPAQRSSLWRFRDLPENQKNYNDNELNCGGFAKQWNGNGGKCGLCGDPFDGDRENEAGGKYAKGIISGTYNAGAVIETEVRITANHLGYFEFRLCAHNDFNTSITQGCLDDNLLQVVESDNSRTTRHYISNVIGVHTLKLQLPVEITCDYCVLQWKYVAGNSWGTDLVTGEGDIGLGPQETFINCADITIHEPGSGSKSSSLATVSATMSVLSSSTSANEVTSKSTTAATSIRTTSVPTTKTTTTTSVPTTKTSTTSAVPTTKTTTTSGVTEAKQDCTGNDNIQCTVTDVYKSISTMNQWCIDNCKVGFCPSTHCKDCTC